MLSLFSTSSDKAGFRLQYMEVFNWGTFDQRVFKITPSGNNSLLTGANGSGKTTFIDALLTLMVPVKKDRFYNQSSGVEKKGDRTEESYVCGHFGDIQKNGELSTTSQMLRNKKDAYSVLLASLSNTEQKTVTIFQVRWFLNGELKRAFGIAHIPLEVEKDFSDFDSRGNWKKRLDKKYNTNATRKKIEFLDGPTKYGERMAHLFGMRSTKALSLFNQVVGIKVLGDLDEFIRANMLEEQEAESEFIQLKESFNTLMDAKNNIEKAKEQIAQLQPINEIAIELTNVEKELNKIRTTRKIGDQWFAKKGVELAEEEAKKCKEDLVVLNEELDVISEKEEELKKEERKLSLTIENDAVGNQIKEIEKEIKQLGKSRDIRTSKFEEYNALAQKVNLDKNPNSELFLKNRNLAKLKKKECENEIEVETENLRQLKNHRDALQEKSEDLVKTIQILQKNKNNISGREAEIREELTAHIGATREEISFIGELVKVREDALEWEASIEKVLHSFALRLVVPEKYYQEVNEYVNQTNLKGRIVYQRFKGHTPLNSMKKETQNETFLINKIAFKENSSYAGWIEDSIIRQYNYSCVESLKEFNRFEERAVTKEGLIKFGKGKHEKDDRSHVSKREHFVLGWDNKEKINLLRLELKKLQEEEKKSVARVKSLEKQIKLLGDLKDDYHSFFTGFTKYDEIDWEYYAHEIQEKEDQKNKLEQANDQLKELQKQLNDVQEHLRAWVRKRDDKVKSISRKESELEGIQKNYQQYVQKLSQIALSKADLTEFGKENTHLIAILYADLQKKQNEFQEELTSRNSKLSDQKNNRERQVSSLISKFKYPPINIVERFKDWRSDVNQLPDPENIEFIGDYQKRYNYLLEEDLPRFETKFNTYLQETIINKVGDFRMFFENWSDSIKENIRLLNASLKEIDFNTGAEKTYIQLVARNKISEDVKTFRSLLHNAIPNFKELQSSIDGKKDHFENNIEPLIKKLNKEDWRKEVMDVRSWFSYKAEEYYRETAEPAKTYENMGQLSGGEKAQLTYTILGSAIAYQFGLTKEGLQSNSFRFIAIDEAFKAQDEDKAQYLMKLCKQLHLQLLVVTPSDNIHIVEPHISFVHFVERKNDKNSWLYDMPIKQFKEEREKYVIEV